MTGGHLAGNIMTFPNREGQIWIDKTPYYNVNKRYAIYLITDSTSRKFYHTIFILYREGAAHFTESIWEGAVISMEIWPFWTRIL